MNETKSVASDPKEKKVMKIYVASSWKNGYQDMVIEYLKEQGHEVYDFKNPGEGHEGFQWSFIDEQWQKWSMKQYIDALKHPNAEHGFKLDLEAMKWADVCVLLLPSGRSAHSEAGWMKGIGKPVYVFHPLPCEPELMYKLYDEVIITNTRFMEIFKRPVPDRKAIAS